MKKSIYTKPKVCRSDKGWYVWFRYNGKLKRYKLGINYIKDIPEREASANALVIALKKKLKKGWNPLVPELPQLGEDLTLMEAIDFCLEKKKDVLAKNSYSCYKGTVKFIKHTIDKLDLNLIKIHDVRRAHVRTIIDSAKKHHKWSNNSRNRHLNHLKALLSELIEEDILESNPAHKIKNLKVPNSNANRTATPEEHRIIRDHLHDNHYNFFVYVATIFHTGIRCWELLQIKIQDIDFHSLQITLPAEITKTRTERIVPINEHLLHHFIKIGAHDVSGDYHLFGSFREPGRGNVGPKLDFIPGPTQMKRDTATKRWKKLVKDGLEIDVNLYSNKHAGADAKIKSGIDINALQELYGHTSKLMTMKYARKVKEVYRKQIMDKSPEY